MRWNKYIKLEEEHQSGQDKRKNMYNVCKIDIFYISLMQNLEYRSCATNVTYPSLSLYKPVYQFSNFSSHQNRWEVYMYGGVPSLFTSITILFVNRLYPNTK